MPVKMSPQSIDARIAAISVARASVTTGIPTIKSTQAVLSLAIRKVFDGCGGAPKPRVLASYLRTLSEQCERAAIAIEEASPKSWQVLCWDTSMSDERKGVANALRFATLEEAQAYGRDLFGRWMGCRKWEAWESTDAVNYRWEFLEGGYGKLARLEDAECA